MTSTPLAYADFLASKAPSDPATGLIRLNTPIAPLFDFQRDLTEWALWRGRAAVFADCGLGKSAVSLEWAHAVVRHTNKSVLILAPLAVALQFVTEGDKFGLPATYARSGAEVRRANGAAVYVTNYERLHAFDPSVFAGVNCDESSILKSYDGATRTQIISAFAETPYRLACTATPAPNDFMELGNHAEYLGVMSRAEMLATFFVHDGGETQAWRLKGHARERFWTWVASWATMVRRPSDLGYTDDGYVLPELRVTPHRVETAEIAFDEAAILQRPASSLQERLVARRESVGDRVQACAELVNATPGAWVAWCSLNAESEALVRAIEGAVEVTGSMALEEKEAILIAFTRGEIERVVTKPKIAAWGMNWQHCHQTAFVGLNDSYESYYQAVRRFWRFGQQHPVDVHTFIASTEGAVSDNLARKVDQADEMAEAMRPHTRTLRARIALGDAAARESDAYARDVARGERWTAHLGDCVEVWRGLDDASIDFTIFSPPFASLYTYSASERDMGNCRTHEEFFAHFRFLIPELFRTTKPGRLCSVHCMNLPTSKARDGVIGLTDFRGEIIRAFVAAGWVYHSEVCIWKDPVTAMQRTKALGLLHKQIKKDSSMSRQGIPDYLVTFRKPGENVARISHSADEFPVELWQQYASPVWMDINPSDTLQFRSVREHEDERHLCPLQLEPIRRALHLWTNPGDLVATPFGGIGSEGVVALEMGRRALLAELKAVYWRQLTANCALAESQASAPSLLDMASDMATDLAMAEGAD